MKKKVSILIVLAMVLSFAAPCFSFDIQDGSILIDAVADLDPSSTITVKSEVATEQALWWSGSSDTRVAVYKFSVPQGAGGLYEFNALASGQYADDWNFASVKVDDTEYIAQGASNVVQYPMAEGWFNSTTEDNFSWFAPGFVQLSEGENTLSVQLRTKQNQGAALLKIKLVPVNENTYEMIDSQGKAVIPVNKLSSVEGDTLTSMSTSDYLAFKPKLQSTVVSVDVYTQKAGDYTLSGDMIFAEMPSHLFYVDTVSVNGVAAHTGSSSNPIASFGVENTTDRYVKELCKVTLLQGKNTISVKLGSTRNNNWVKLYSLNLEQYQAPIVTPPPVPSFTITNGAVVVETNEQNAASINTSEWRSESMIRLRGNGQSVTYKVISPEACAYDLTLDFNMLQLSQSAQNMGFTIAVNENTEIDGSSKPFNTADYPQTGYDASNVHYTDVAVGKINLIQGDNLIKIEFKETSNSVIDLYKFKLNKAIVVVPTPTPVPTQRPIPSFTITEGSLELNTNETNAVSVDATDWRSADMIRLRGNGGGATYKVVAPEIGSYNITADFNAIQWLNATVGFGFNLWVNDVLVVDGSTRPLSAESYPAAAYKTTPDHTGVSIGQINLRQGENIIKVALKESGQSVVDLYKLTFTEFIDPVIVLDENNANNTESKGSVTNNAGLNVIVQTTEGASSVNGSYYTVTYKTNPEFVFKPNLASGKYEVFINRPVLRSVGKDFLNMTAEINGANGSKSVRYSNSVGSGRAGWYSLGVHTFAGTSDDKVTIKGDSLALVNTLLGDGNEVEQLDCVIDAVKFVPYTSAQETVNELIIDETNRVSVNPTYIGETVPEDKFVSAEKDGYGYAHLNNIDFYNSWSKGGLGTTNLFPATGSVLASAFGTYSSKEYGVDYYPNLTPGYYKVFVSRPAGFHDETVSTITNRADVFGNSTTESFTYTIQNDSASNWYELGVFEFAGDYGKEYVKITHISGTHSVFDAVKFVRIPTLEAADITVESPAMSPTVLRNSVFRLKSDLVLDKTTVNDSTVYIKLRDDVTKVAANTAISADGIDITVTPNNNLVDGTYYTLVIEGVKDKFGRNAVNKSIDFLVDLDIQSPQATLTEPANLSNVATNSVFKLTFSEDVFNIDKASSYSIYDGNNKIDVVPVVVTDKREVTLVPSQALDPSKTYTLVIGSAVVDVSGNPVTDTSVFKFTTASSSVDNSLTVSMVYPESVYQLELKPTFTLLFNYKIDAMYADEKFISIMTSNGEYVSTEVKKTGDNSFTVSPRENLAQNTVYKIVFSDSIRSLTGKMFADTYDINFKTRFSDSYTENFAVSTVTSTVEGDGGVTVKFNAPVDLRSVNKSTIIIKKDNVLADYKIETVDVNAIKAVPETAWAEGDHAITIKADVKSIDGVSLVSDDARTFTAGKKTISAETSAITTTTANASADYYNSSSSTKTLTGLLYVIENGVITNIKTVETQAPAGSTVPVSASMTGMTNGSGAYSQFIVLENPSTLKPASNMASVSLTASLLETKGTQINISGKINPGSSRKITYIIAKPGATVVSNTSDIIYIGTVNSSDDGTYDITYTLPNSVPYDTYSIVVNAEGAEAPVTLSFENVSEYILNNINSSVNTAVQSNDYVTLENIIIQSGSALGINSSVAAQLSAAPNKSQILQSITGSDDCAEKVVLGLINNGVDTTTAAALGKSAGLTDAEAQVFASSLAVALFNNAKPFTDKADVLKNMRASVAISELNNKSTSDYGNILREYDDDLGIVVPNTITTSLLNGLYSVRAELTIDNFASKFATANTVQNITPQYPTTDGGGGGGAAGAFVPTPVITEQSVTSPDVPQTTVTSTVFTDVSSSHWANEAIEYMYNAGIISGVGDGRFEPEASVMREQFVKMIVVAFDIPIGNIENTFEDVDTEQWYCPYILAAYNAGLINGYSDSLFGVGNMITREDMAVIIYRALEKLEISIEAGSSAEFADSTEISQYASEAVSKLTAGGIMNGMGDGTFKSKNNATRAMAAKLIYELLKI